MEQRARMPCVCALHKNRRLTNEGQSGEAFVVNLMSFHKGGGDIRRYGDEDSHNGVCLFSRLDVALGLSVYRAEWLLWRTLNDGREERWGSHLAGRPTGWLIKSVITSTTMWPYPNNVFSIFDPCPSKCPNWEIRGDGAWVS